MKKSYFLFSILSIVFFVFVFLFGTRGIVNLYRFEYSNRPVLEGRKYFYIFLMGFGLLGTLLQFGILSFRMSKK